MSASAAIFIALSAERHASATLKKAEHLSLNAPICFDVKSGSSMRAREAATAKLAPEPMARQGHISQGDSDSHTSDAPRIPSCGSKTSPRPVISSTLSASATIREAWNTTSMSNGRQQNPFVHRAFSRTCLFSRAWPIPLPPSQSDLRSLDA